MFKKIISLLLCAPLMFAFPIAFASQSSEAKLYGIYGDGMLFAQNKDAILNGTAPDGTKITASLYDSADALISKGESTAANGTFSVSFKAPAGGYTEYTVILTAGSTEFARLKNVVFGELWLASGQSNMMYPLAQDKTGREMAAENKKLSRWLRVLVEPAYPEYNGSAEKIPVEPQNDIKDTLWINGENAEIYGMSAVAYHFAAALEEKIGMPVGILNSSLGGTSICSWLSREAIDSDPAAKEILVKKGMYIQKSDWNEDKVDIYRDMTTNFNLRTNAYSGFRPSGMIWYQGESDLIYAYTPEEYAVLFDLMQRSYTEHFGYEGGMLPIVYTHIAPYFYSETGLNTLDWNIGYTEMQTARPESRAVITNYDIPVTYLPETGLIHPEHKQEIGERMAFAADGLVYGNNETYCAAAADKFEIIGSDVFVTFRDVCSGLKVNGDKLYGFTLCGENGIFAAADAEIVAPDKVRVYSEFIKSPVGISYAYCINNYRSDLFSTYGEKTVMPVSPFVYGAPENSVYWTDLPWTDCENSELWYNRSDTEADYYPAWQADGATLDFTAENNIKITSGEKNFSVSPVTSFTEGIETKAFRDLRKDYSSYGTLSFYIRNNGDSPVTVEGADFCKNSIIGYTAFADNATVPADGEWHRVKLNLNSLSICKKEGLLCFSNNSLKNVSEINLHFSCSGNADISLDTFRFAPESEDSSFRFNFDNTVLSAFVTAIVTFVSGLFN